MAANGFMMQLGLDQAQDFAGKVSAPKLSLKPDKDPYDLPPSEQHILNEIASAQTGTVTTADDFLAAAATGKTVKDIAREGLEAKVREKGMELSLKYGWMDPADFRSKVSQDMQAMGLQMPASTLGDQLDMPDDASPFTQDVMHSAQLSAMFGEEAAKAIYEGNLTPETTAFAIQKLDTPRYDRVMQVYEQLIGARPEAPDDAGLDTPNEWMVLAAALTAVLAPKYAYRAAATPAQFMLMERQRRQARADQQYAGQRQDWNNAIDSVNGMAQSALRVDVADYEGQIDQQNKFIDLQKSRESNSSKEAIAAAKSSAQARIEQMRQEGKITEIDAKAARQMLEAISDPQTSSGVANSLRQAFANRFGYDPLAGGPPVTSYKEDLAQSQSALNYERVETELARQGLTAAQARKVSIEADLLPQKFEFDVWAKAADIKMKVSDQQIRLADLDAKTAKGAADVVTKTMDALNEQAKSLDEQAKSLDEQAVMSRSDKERASSLKSQSDQLRGQAARAREAANSYQTTLDTLKTRIATAAPSSVDNSVAPFKPGKLGEKYVGKYDYSMRRGKGELDCSSFTQCVYKDNGISIPGTAQSQYDATREVPEGQVQPGDLVFFKDTRPSSARKGLRVHHVGIVASVDGGKITMRHMSQAKDDVQTIGLDEYLRGTGGRMQFLGARRPDGGKAGGTGSAGRQKQASGADEVGAALGLEPDDNKITMVLAQGLAKGVRRLSTSERPQAGDIALIEDEPGKAYRPMMIESVATEKGVMTVTFIAGGKRFKKPASQVKMHVYRRGA